MSWKLNVAEERAKLNAEVARKRVDTGALAKATRFPERLVADFLAGTEDAGPSLAMHIADCLALVPEPAPSASAKSEPKAPAPAKASPPITQPSPAPSNGIASLAATRASAPAPALAVDRLRPKAADTPTTPTAEERRTLLLEGRDAELVARENDALDGILASSTSAEIDALNPTLRARVIARRILAAGKGA